MIDQQAVLILWCMFVFCVLCYLAGYYRGRFLESCRIGLDWEKCSETLHASYERELLFLRTLVTIYTNRNRVDE